MLHLNINLNLVLLYIDTLCIHIYNNINIIINRISSILIYILSLLYSNLYSIMLLLYIYIFIILPYKINSYYILLSKKVVRKLPKRKNKKRGKVTVNVINNIDIITDYINYANSKSLLLHNNSNHNNTNNNSNNNSNNTDTNNNNNDIINKDSIISNNNTPLFITPNIYKHYTYDYFNNTDNIKPIIIDDSDYNNIDEEALINNMQSFTNSLSSNNNRVINNDRLLIDNNTNYNDGISNKSLLITDTLSTNNTIDTLPIDPLSNSNNISPLAGPALTKVRAGNKIVDPIITNNDINNVTNASLTNNTDDHYNDYYDSIYLLDHNNNNNDSIPSDNSSNNNSNTNNNSNSNSNSNNNNNNNTNTNTNTINNNITNNNTTNNIPSDDIYHDHYDDDIDNMDWSINDILAIDSGTNNITNINSHHVSSSNSNGGNNDDDDSNNNSKTTINNNNIIKHKYTYNIDPIPMDYYDNNYSTIVNKRSIPKDKLVDIPDVIIYIFSAMLLSGGSMQVTYKPTNAIRINSDIFMTNLVGVHQLYNVLSNYYMVNSKFTNIKSRTTSINYTMEKVYGHKVNTWSMAGINNLYNDFYAINNGYILINNYNISLYMSPITLCYFILLSSIRHTNRIIFNNGIIGMDNIVNVIYVLYDIHILYNKKDNYYYIDTYDITNMNKLRALILPHMLPSMMYVIKKSYN